MLRDVSGDAWIHFARNGTTYTMARKCTKLCTIVIQSGWLTNFVPRVVDSWLSRSSVPQQGGACVECKRKLCLVIIEQ
jgi:hypothetical protein